MFFYKHFLRPPHDDAPLSELEDVQRNLRWILETRRGSGHFLPTFGMSDMGNRSPAELVTVLRQELMENVRLYEPRLELIDVDEDWDDEGHRTKLTLRARLRGTGDGVDVAFDLQKREIHVGAGKRGGR